MLNGLRSQPEVLHAEVMTAAGLRELRVQSAENVCRFAGNPDQRFAPIFRNAAAARCFSLASLIKSGFRRG